jgi:hypothetical protein
VVLQEESLGDGVLVALQPEQTTLVDHIPHDDIRVLERKRET